MDLDLNMDFFLNGDDPTLGMVLAGDDSSLWEHFDSPLLSDEGNNLEPALRANPASISLSASSFSVPSSSTQPAQSNSPVLKISRQWLYIYIYIYIF
uniref:ICA69 domain-containing protein n=1 Tax=Heterorhabditis bacteriophora TaxID=37862 RepID=A0A1I7W8U6_HETBA